MRACSDHLPSPSEASHRQTHYHLDLDHHSLQPLPFAQIPTPSEPCPPPISPTAPFPPSTDPTASSVPDRSCHLFERHSNVHPLPFVPSFPISGIPIVFFVDGVGFQNLIFRGCGQTPCLSRWRCHEICCWILCVGLRMVECRSGWIGRVRMLPFPGPMIDQFHCMTL